MRKKSFDLDRALLCLSDSKGQSTWRIRDAVEGVQIFGGIGSGKTSGSGRQLALKYLSNGFGGLVLTAKADEKDLWIEYCKKTRRTKDLIIIEPNGKHHFNFLDYETSNTTGGVSLTENVVQVLKTVIRASVEKSSGKVDDPFWETALDMLISNAIDMCRMAYSRVTLQELYDLVATAPKKGKKGKGSFDSAFKMIRDKMDALTERLKEQLTPEEKEHWDDEVVKERIILKRIPMARGLKSLDDFFNVQYHNLSEKTRSIIEFSFSGFLFRLMQEPVYSLFCKGESNVLPEDCLNGKIILLNLPVKTYNKVGRDCQIMFKYIWQRAMERRNVKKNDRPVFLWADESQNFLHEYDADYQATARSSRIATVYISQNLPNYHANMGGVHAEYRVKSFLGTLATKIFHANADIGTNAYASDLIGSAYTEEMTRSSTVAGDFSSGQSKKYTLEKMVRPEQFVSLKTGATFNGFLVGAYIHKQGNAFHDGWNHLKIEFKQ